jgi:serine phosphatase RsbU (regulator of sigma subunit)
MVSNAGAYGWSGFFREPLNMFQRISSKIPLKISVPLLLTAPVLGVVIVLSLLFFAQGRVSVNDLMEQNLTQIHDRINKKIDEQMKMPVRIAHINTNLFERGKFSTSHIQELGLTLFNQLQAFDMLSAIVWGDLDGRALRVERGPDPGSYELAIKDDINSNIVSRFRLDDTGMIKSSKTVLVDWDPRLQPWYKAGISAARPTWSEIYSWDFEQRSGAAPRMAFVRPLRNIEQEITGVIGVELSLDDISNILDKLHVGKTGHVFIMDRKGRLIANSSRLPVTDPKNRLLKLSESYDKHITAAAKELESAFGSIETIKVPNQIRMHIDEDPHILMVSPSKHDTGLTWIIATLVPESDFMAEMDTWRQQSIKIGVIAILITMVLGIIFAAISLWPMLDLIAYVRKVGQGDLRHELKLPYASEFVQLSKEINSMTAGLRDRSRLRNAIALAQEVQQNLLPQHPPQKKGLDIAGVTIYCDETGGDYYDYLSLGKNNSDKIGVVVGDVSDHGIQSALLMVSARALIRQQAYHSEDIISIVNEVNIHLSRDLRESGHFMTLFLCEIDLKKKTFRWVRAGHDPGIFYDTKTDSFDELSGIGLPLGVFENSEYGNSKMSIAPGQIFFIGTDGIWEARNTKGEKFGKRAVRDIIRANAAKTSENIRDAVIAELENFSRPLKKEDDVTLVVIKINDDL